VLVVSCAVIFLSLLTYGIVREVQASRIEAARSAQAARNRAEYTKAVKARIDNLEAQNTPLKAGSGTGQSLCLSASAP
jgi:hypothetical protein